MGGNRACRLLYPWRARWEVLAGTHENVHKGAMICGLNDDLTSATSTCFRAERIHRLPQEDQNADPRNRRTP